MFYGQQYYERPVTLLPFTPKYRRQKRHGFANSPILKLASTMTHSKTLELQSAADCFVCYQF
jgi:hypothetical protein